MVIRDIAKTIKATKPDVEFGISPFGVWRNNTRDSLGSATTAGLTNYDNLYADVLYWIREGWIDYVCPQLYWHIGNRAADYNTLAHWWAQRVDEANLEYAKKSFGRLTTEEIVPPASRDDIIHPRPCLSHSANSISAWRLIDLVVKKKLPLGVPAMRLTDK